MAFLRAAGVFLAVSWCSQVMAAKPKADPSVRHLFPVAGIQGTTVAVKVSGKFDPWPQQVWVDAPGITFKPSEKNNGTFEVEIAKDAAPGPHLIRFFSESDVSGPPRYFIVTTQPETLEKEPNDDYHAPQKIEALPATVSGRLDKGGDVDSFAVTLRRGQTLVAWVEAYVLASTFDGMLRIVDTEGHELAFNHDGRTLDPFLAWTAPSDGTFLVQHSGFAYPANSEVKLTGGEGTVYRLHLCGGPFVRHTLPLAVQRGVKTKVELVGWNLASPTAEIDGTNLAAGETALESLLPGVAAEQALTISENPEELEKEGQRLEVPSGVTGHIAQTGEEDRFTFAAVKGKAYQLFLEAARVGSALDAWLKIENKEGKELVRNDDAEGSRDARLTWTAPADGDFVAVIGDVTHHGGPEYVYRLAIAEAVPAVEGTLAGHSVSIEPGKAGEVKVAVKRTNGFKVALQLAAKNLPEGISAPEVEVPKKDGEVTLKIDVAEGANPFSGPVQLVLREVEGGKEYAVVHRMTTTGENNGVPQGYRDLVIEGTDQIWLSVAKGK